MVLNVSTECVDCNQQNLGSANQDGPHWVPVSPGSVVSADASLISVKAQQDDKGSENQNAPALPKELASPMTASWIRQGPIVPSTQADNAKPGGSLKTLLLGAASKAAETPEHKTVSTRTLLQAAVAKR